MLTNLAKIFLFSVSCFALFLGLTQLSSQKDILDDARPMCCESGYCTKVNCSLKSTMAHEDYYNCEREVELQCRDCILAIRNLKICGLEETYYDYCDSLGQRFSTYYFLEYPLSVSISGPYTRAPFQQGTWIASVSGGITPYSYQWYYQNPCDKSSTENGETRKPPCGDWYAIGTNSSSITRYDTEGFELKCVVTDSHIEHNTDEDIFYVIVTSSKNSLNLHEPGFTGTPNNKFTIQNYPNPFNPSTIINFNLPEKAHVVLRIYNSIGEKISVLLNEELKTGVHSVVFNGSNLPSGIYYYTMSTKNFTKSGKMILAK